MAWHLELRIHNHESMTSNRAWMACSSVFWDALGGTGALLTRQLDILGIRRYRGRLVEGGQGRSKGSRHEEEMKDRWNLYGKLALSQWSKRGLSVTQDSNNNKKRLWTTSGFFFLCEGNRKCSIQVTKKQSCNRVRTFKYTKQHIKKTTCLCTHKMEKLSKSLQKS